MKQSINNKYEYIKKWQKENLKRISLVFKNDLWQEVNDKILLPENKTINKYIIELIKNDLENRNKNDSTTLTKCKTDKPALESEIDMPVLDDDNIPF